MKDPTKINVLVACEESQRVCMAFRDRGFNAFSCDIQECSGGHPEYHILGDAVKALDAGEITTMDGKTHHEGVFDYCNALIDSLEIPHCIIQVPRWAYVPGDKEGEECQAKQK